MKTQILVVLAGLSILRVEAQSVLFDFENAPVGSQVPFNLTVGGITASFSKTGLGGFFVQQPASASLPTPQGFSGYCLIPTGIDAADLQVGFSVALTDFSILYAPHELACDSSATMRVTAYLNGTFVATATTNATWNCSCTWTSQLLPISSTRPFNSVVVHYDAPPSPIPNPCQDYGTIFLADNLTVTPAPPPIVLSQATRQDNGAFQFAFTNVPGATFTVLASTNAALSLSNWNVLGIVTEISSGQYQFTDSQATNQPLCFYRVRSP